MIEIGNLLPGPYHAIVIDSALQRIGVTLTTPVRFTSRVAALEQRSFVVPTAADYVAAGCLKVYGQKPDSSVGWFMGRIFDSNRLPMDNAQWKASRTTRTADEHAIYPGGAGFTGSDGLFFGCGGYGERDFLTISVREAGTPRWISRTAPSTGLVTVIRFDMPPAEPAKGQPR
jgi:hypothetical protein